MSLVAIYVYQQLAPDSVRQACRFTPTCSEYAREALRSYGFWVGWRVAIARLVRCRPPNGGVDPVSRRSSRDTEPVGWDA